MKTKFAAVGAAAVFAVCIGGSAVAAPQQYDQHTVTTTTTYRTDRLSTEGRISAVAREGDRYRVTLDHGDYTYWVPATSVRGRDLVIGTQVRLGGIIDNDAVNVDLLAFPGEAYYTSDPNYRPVPMGSTGWMTGTVERVNRHLGYIEIREDGTGNMIKIDARHMNMRHPVNVWGFHGGDHITVNGSWEKPGLFDARLIEY